MSYLSEEMVKRACAYVIRVNKPLLTCREILLIFSERDIRVNSMNLHNMDREEGFLIIHCRMERDRSKYILSLIEKLKWVAEAELLESRTSNLLKGNLPDAN